MSPLVQKETVLEHVSVCTCGSQLYIDLCAKSDKKVSNVCQSKYILAISSDKGVKSLSQQELIWKFCNNLTGHFVYLLKLILRKFWGPTYHLSPLITYLKQNGTPIVKLF